MTWKPPITPSERRIASILRRAGYLIACGEKLHGYYPDIRILGTKLLIEVDGGYHKTADQKAKDKARSAILRKHGYKVIRCTNRQVEKNPVGVLKKVRTALSKGSKRRSVKRKRVK